MLELYVLAKKKKTQGRYLHKRYCYLGVSVINSIFVNKYAVKNFRQCVMDNNFSYRLVIASINASNDDVLSFEVVPYRRITEAFSGTIFSDLEHTPSCSSFPSYISYRSVTYRFTIKKCSHFLPY